MWHKFRAVWIGLLLVGLAGGYYLFGRQNEEPDWLTRLDSANAAGQSHQSYWAERLGWDAQLTYHLLYSCGHDRLFTSEQLAASGLDSALSDFDGAMKALQVESRQGELVTLTGGLPLLCPDCQSSYLITEQDGCVAVFQGRNKDSAVLIKCYTDMPLSRLPEDVQRRVREGIVVHSEEELARVLEGLDG